MSFNVVERDIAFYDENFDVPSEVILRVITPTDPNLSVSTCDGTPIQDTVVLKLRSNDDKEDSLQNFELKDVFDPWRSHHIDDKMSTFLIVAWRVFTRVFLRKCIRDRDDEELRERAELYLHAMSVPQILYAFATIKNVYDNSEDFESFMNRRYDEETEYELYNVIRSVADFSIEPEVFDDLDEEKLLLWVISYLHLDCYETYQSMCLKIESLPWVKEGYVLEYSIMKDTDSYDHDRIFDVKSWLNI